jgi:hypothetical protein
VDFYSDLRMHGIRTYSELEQARMSNVEVEGECRLCIPSLPVQKTTSSLREKAFLLERLTARRTKIYF